MEEAPEEKKARPGGPGGDKDCGRNLKYTRRGGPNPEAQLLTGREDQFTELGDLTALYEGLATHVRQHVNPLSRALQVPTPAPQWDEVFRDPALPLQIDVGCGSGRFVLIRAKRLSGASAAAGAASAVDAAEPSATADSTAAASSAGAAGGAAGGGGAAEAGSGRARANVLGLEIRQKLVDRANEWSKRLHLENCRFIFTNATVSWKSLFESYPGPIELVSMQFPDPHFKKKHHKRRHVQPRLVQELVETLAPDARVFLQGDVPEAVRWMRDMFDRHSGDRVSLAPECVGQPGLLRDEWSSDAAAQDCDDGPGEDGEDADLEGEGATGAAEPAGSALRWSGDSSAGWLPTNPLGVATEREVYVGKINAPVFRVMLRRS